MSGNVLDVTPETIRLSFETNFHGPARLTQLAVPMLRRSGAARVVMVSSTAGSFAWMSNFNPQFDATKLPYACCISKMALNAATVLFAAALRQSGIKVNACNPGYVKSRVSHFMGTRSPKEGARMLCISRRWTTTVRQAVSSMNTALFLGKGSLVVPPSTEMQVTAHQVYQDCMSVAYAMPVSCPLS